MWTFVIPQRHKSKEIFFPVMRTLRIYSLNSFPVEHATVLITLIVLYITSLVFIHLITGGLYLLTALNQFPLPTRVCWYSDCKYTVIVEDLEKSTTILPLRDITLKNSGMFPFSLFSPIYKIFFFNLIFNWWNFRDCHPVKWKPSFRKREIF